MRHSDVSNCTKEVIHIARRKIDTRKFTPRNEFRFNFSPHAKGHPHYVFGEKGDKYKSIGLTTSPRPDIKHFELKKNPDPQNTKDKSYIQLTKPHTAHKKYYSDVLQGWSFAKEDMPIARHRIKQYKKSMNRKPPMWYEKKRKNNKKRNESS